MSNVDARTSADAPAGSGQDRGAVALPGNGGDPAGPAGPQPRSSTHDRRAMVRAFGPVLVLAALFIGFALLHPQFATLNNGLNLMRQSSVLLVLAIAGTFIILMGSIDLSIGSTATLAAVTGAVLLRDYDSPVVLLLVPLIGAACGAVNGLLTAYARLPSFLVTLGTLFIFDGFALFVSQGRPIPVSDLGGLHSVFLGSAILNIPNLVFFSLLVLVLAQVTAKWTRFGRFTYAIGGGEQVSALSGVPVRRVKLYAFVMSGVLSATGGLLLMFRVGSGAPGIGEPFLLASIGAIVVGGTPLTGGLGGPHRTLLGVVIMAVLSNGMSVASVHPFLQTIVQGAVVIAAVALTIDTRRMAIVK